MKTWHEAIRQWAARSTSIREVWLFGSHAQCTAGPDSDVDLAITLMPPNNGTDWALGRYSRFGDDWQSELETIVGRHVSLELLPDTDIGPRILLWRRAADSPAR
jgi:predicted nucleotidyltransferase